MTTTPEGKVKAEVKKFLDSLGPDCWYFMSVSMGYGRRGIPDFIGCYNGRFFAIETKRKGAKAMIWQAREAQAIRAAGAPCLEVNGDAAWLASWFAEYLK